MSHVYDRNRFLAQTESGGPYELYGEMYGRDMMGAGRGVSMEATPYELDFSTQMNIEQDLENQPELHNEQRLFSFLLPKSVPPLTSPDERKPYPHYTLNFLNKMVFFWNIPILYKGYKRTLLPDDLFYLPDHVKVEPMHRKFDQSLRRRIDKAKEKYMKKNGSLDGFKWSPNLIPLSLFETFWWQYTRSTIYLALAFCCEGLSPLVSKALINFVEDRFLGLESTYNRGVGLTIGAVILIMVNGLLLNHFFYNSMMTGAQSKAILTKSLLLKSFRLSARSREEYSVARITSIMSTDLARIDLAFAYQPILVCFPILVVIAIVLLLVNIGVSSLAGIGLFVISLFVCLISTRKLFVLREKVLEHTDKRIGLVREVLNNLKIIKFYAWELAYKYNIADARQKEMKYLFSIKVLRDVVTSYAVTIPTLSSMLSFVTMWASSSMKSPAEVFSSLSLFSILGQAVMLLPITLATGADALIGFGRCRDFLMAEETELDDYTLKDSNSSEFEFGGAPEPENDVVIEIENANFVWESALSRKHSALDYNSSGDEQKKTHSNGTSGKNYGIQNKEKYIDESDESGSSNDTCYEPDYYSLQGNQFPGLHNINLKIKRNEFVIVTGSIGSGKSTLLAALSGTMKLANPNTGHYVKNGESLLCSIPWMQNATIRENILFGRPYDAKRYQDVVSACCLLDDFKTFPAKDMTEIGERGINLSGGQKARISLARACYSDINVLLFDDVLSAVDSRVGTHIVKNLFNDFLKDRTKILATHQLSTIQSADKIIYLRGDGSIDCGSLEELRFRNDQFRRLLDFNIQSKPEEEPKVSVEEQQAYERKFADISKQEEFDSAGRMMADEEKATNALSYKVYKMYITLGNGIFGSFAPILFVLLVIIATYCQLFTNTWLSYWTQKKFVGRSDDFYVGYYVMFAVLTVFFTALEFIMLAYMNNNSASLLNVRAISRILHVPMSFIDTNPIGRVLNRFTKDTDSLDNEIGEQLRLFIFPFAIIIGINILCICYLPWYAIAVPFLFFAFLFLSNFYQGASREIKRLEALQRSLVYNNFNETLTGMSTIQEYKMEYSFIAKNDKYINLMNEAYYLTIANQRWLAINLDIVVSCFALIICLLCVTGQFNIGPSSTGLLLSYVIQIVGLLSLTVRAMTQVENEMNSAERLHHYAYKIPQEPEYKKPETAPPPEWPSSGYIKFDNISMRYRPGLPLVLKDMNLNVYPGEKVGICGKTGAGKSSLMSALYRLCELDKGSITIDGLDIKDLGLYELRSKLSMIPQDPVLFQGTIRSNLDPFNEYPDDLLWDALRRSGLIKADEIARAKQITEPQSGNELHKFHLKQVVTQDGGNLSLGERQLIALARALVRNSKVLILDEATSSVDFETDANIQDTIAEEFSQCTILCIAHRLQTILNYDRIVVIDDGRIVEKGTPVSLFKAGGVFRKMCDKAHIDSSEFDKY